MEEEREERPPYAISAAPPLSLVFCLALMSRTRYALSQRPQIAKSAVLGQVRLEFSSNSTFSLYQQNSLFTTTTTYLFILEILYSRCLNIGN
jgi:hypothetical protein